MKNKIKFMRIENISRTPISYQFMNGFKLVPNGKSVDFTFEIQKYQSKRCNLFSHYKPISKIIN